MNEKIFCMYKCLKFMETIWKNETQLSLLLIHFDWMIKCEGKTEKEINNMGFMTRKEFMI